MQDSHNTGHRLEDCTSLSHSNDANLPDWRDLNACFSTLSKQNQVHSRECVCVCLTASNLKVKKQKLTSAPAMSHVIFELLQKKKEGSH